MNGRLKLNYSSYVHKRIRHSVSILEGLTDSECSNLNNEYSGFLLFKTKDKKCAFIITSLRQFYFISLVDSYCDNIYKILIDNTKIIDSILNDFDWLLLDYK